MPGGCRMATIANLESAKKDVERARSFRKAVDSTFPWGPDATSQESARELESYVTDNVLRPAVGRAAAAGVGSAFEKDRQPELESRLMHEFGDRAVRALKLLSTAPSP